MNIKGWHQIFNLAGSRCETNPEAAVDATAAMVQPGILKDEQS